MPYSQSFLFGQQFWLCSHAQRRYHLYFWSVWLSSYTAVHHIDSNYNFVLQLHTWVKLVGIFVAAGGAITIELTSPNKMKTEMRNASDTESTSRGPVSQETLGYMSLLANTLCMVSWQVGCRTCVALETCCVSIIWCLKSNLGNLCLTTKEVHLQQTKLYISFFRSSHTHTHTHTYTHTHTHSHTHTHTHIHLRVHTHAYTCTHTCIHTHNVTLTS